MRAGIEINPAEETLSTTGLAVRFMVTGANSNGSVAAFELMVPAGKQLPAPVHGHDHYEETVYGVEGGIPFTVEGNAGAGGPGATLCIPRRAVHRFENTGSADAKALCLISPAAI